MATLHPPSMFENYLKNFGRIMVSLVGGVKLKKNPTSRIQALLQVAQKKIPIVVIPPPCIFSATMKGCGKRSDEIKLSSELRELCLILDFIDDAVNA